MTVYADEAFLLNGAVDYLLLICAAKLGGGRIARLRLLAAALFGGNAAAVRTAWRFAGASNEADKPRRDAADRIRRRPSNPPHGFWQQVVRLRVLRS